MRYAAGRWPEGCRPASGFAPHRARRQFVNEVLYEQDGHIATITLNRPEAMNALNTPLRMRLREAFERFRDSSEAWVAIVTGAGDRAFSAGADLKEMSQRNRALHEGGRDAFWEPE